MILVSLIGLSVLVLAIFVYMYSYNKSRTISMMKIKYGIPYGKITYTDLDKPAKYLLSRKHMIVGKPDYIVKMKDKYIPIEAKPTRIGTPFKNHILQLAAYCLLVEDLKKEIVPYGVLVYKDTQHIIPFDDRLRNELLNVILEIRAKIATKDVTRNHNFVARCQFCSFRGNCDQKLF